MLVSLIPSRVFADGDYYRALQRAEQEAVAGRFDAALQLVDVALQTYAGDYQLTLTRARLLVRMERYASAKISYADAIRISAGAPEARLGMGWLLSLQGECRGAIQEFREVLRIAPHDAAAQRGIAQCRWNEVAHGSLWLTGGAALFQSHPWKRRFGDTSGGFTIQPPGGLLFGLAYHYLRLTATDRRVEAIDQRELYAQAGFIAGGLTLLAHGALVWSGDPWIDGSTHAVISGHYRGLSSWLPELSAELAASRYPDFWVGRFATAWRFAAGTWSILPGMALIRSQLNMLTSVSLSLSKSFGALSLWLGGKYGPELRAAYLSQFALLNSEDRSLWSITGGARMAVTKHWWLLVSYLYLKMHTPDGLAASMHFGSTGLGYNF